MKIVVFGAGAIGSFFGGLLSKQNKVCLIGRKKHVDSINKNGLRITGKTEYLADVDAVESAEDVDFKPDLLILTVKSYDTYDAVKQAVNLIDKCTLFLSIQNGLDNIEKIKQVVDLKFLAAGITTNGVIFEKPGEIKHTGKGDTVLGMVNKKTNRKIFNVLKNLNECNIKSTISDDIRKDIWIKGIVNSSINPLTSFFDCKNGYLLKNPILEIIVEKICYESTFIARSNDININYRIMLEKTKNIIMDTSDNYSSMLQSVKKNKKTEINSINGKLVEVGKENNKNVFFNQILVNLINQL